MPPVAEDWESGARFAVFDHVQPSLGVSGVTSARGGSAWHPADRSKHMASKTAFTPEEWNQVLGGVFMAGFAVTAADPSGLWGLLKETFASGRALLEAKSHASASELSKAIVSDMETSEGRSAAQA